MAFLGTEKLKDVLKSKHAVMPFDENRVKCGAYELSLGDEFYRTDSKDKKKEFLTKPKELVTINPGQFALLLTNETVNIPPNYIALISIKASIKLRGLINVSGFHIDPGYEGKLIFSVYNAGSGPVSLVRGEPCFLMWFSALEITSGEDSYEKTGQEHKNLDTIPPKYIDGLNHLELASPNVLLDKINDNYKTLDGKATTRDYIFKTGLGIIIVVGLKFLLDWGVYSRGFDEGMARMKEEIQTDSIINALLNEKKLLLKEIDSLSDKDPVANDK